jgi:glycerol kinase
LIGITRNTNAAHIARATLEAIAFEVADLLDAMRSDTGTQAAELRVDGGASRSQPLMQFQADILGIPIVRPAVTETTALGAAYLAGLAVGYWKDPQAIAGQWKVEGTFEPKMARDRVAELRSRWSEAVDRAKGWERSLPASGGPRRKQRKTRT